MIGQYSHKQAKHAPLGVMGVGGWWVLLHHAKHKNKCYEKKSYQGHPSIHDATLVVEPGHLRELNDFKLGFAFRKPRHFFFCKKAPNSKATGLKDHQRSQTRKTSSPEEGSAKGVRKIPNKETLSKALS